MTGWAERPSRASPEIRKAAIEDLSRRQRSERQLLMQGRRTGRMGKGADGGRHALLLTEYACKMAIIEVTGSRHDRQFRMAALLLERAAALAVLNTQQAGERQHGKPRRRSDYGSLSQRHRMERRILQERLRCGLR